jgi:hypothetical protein
VGGLRSFDEPPPWQLARLMDGYLTTQLLYVAATLGIADVLASGPRTGPDIARAVGADPDALSRALRGLVIEDVLDEDDDGRFSLTTLGAYLRDGVPGSMRGAAIVRGELYFRAAAAMLPAVVRGGTGFERVYGQPFFSYLGAHADLDAAFTASMAARAEQEATDVAAVYDFGAIERIVDVGGGPGVLLEAILKVAPHLSAVLLDRPAVIERARARLDAAGLGPRCAFVEGDFFTQVPPGGDAYLISRVLHDWDDTEAARILGVCRQAMTAQSRLLVVEAILPQRAREQPAAVRMDLHMMLLLGSRERTEAQFRDLLDGAGLEVCRIVPTSSPAGLSVIEARRLT